MVMGWSDFRADFAKALKNQKESTRVDTISPWSYCVGLPFFSLMYLCNINKKQEINLCETSSGGKILPNLGYQIMWAPWELIRFIADRESYWGRALAGILLLPLATVLYLTCGMVTLIALTARNVIQAGKNLAEGFPSLFNEHSNLKTPWFESGLVLMGFSLGLLFSLQAFTHVTVMSAIQLGILTLGGGVASAVDWILNGAVFLMNLIPGVGIPFLGSASQLALLAVSQCVFAMVFMTAILGLAGKGIDYVINSAQTAKP